MGDATVPTSVAIEEESDQNKLRDHISNLKRNLADWEDRKKTAAQRGGLPAAVYDGAISYARRQLDKTQTRLDELRLGPQGVKRRDMRKSEIEKRRERIKMAQQVHGGLRRRAEGGDVSLSLEFGSLSIHHRRL
jgi:DNA repair exonuclease SbcCD ATPase subunit